MAKILQTQIDIDASKEKVWAILADFAAYPRWNPFITSISGDLRTGAKLAVHFRPPGRRDTTFYPEVLSVVPGREVKWLGHLLIPGIFDGEHHLLIQEMAPSKVVFVQSEIFKGVLVPFTGRMLESTRQGFERMNEALRRRAEAED